jgi:predicted RND superfamily exporter protein
MHPDMDKAGSPNALSACAVRWARWVDAHRRAILIGALLASIASVILASQLPVQGDFSYLLPPSELSVQHLHALERRTRALSTFMIGIESDDPALREQAAKALDERIEQLDKTLVANVSYDDRVAHQYAWDNRFLFAPLQDLETARAVLEKKRAEANPLYVPLDEDPGASAGDEKRLADLREQLAKLKKEAESPSIHVSRDGRLQMILVRSAFSSDDIGRGRQLLHELEQANDAVRSQFPTMTIGMTGDVITTQAEQGALLNGMLISTLITVGLVLFALLAFYRSGASVLALLGSLGVGVLVTFGYTKLSVGHLNLASAFLSSIVIGNGINFGIILLARYLEERRAGRQGTDAIAVAMAGTGHGTLAAALTAAVAYGSLAVTDFRGFRDFGIIGGVGMVLCWISAYTVFPALLASLDRRGLIRVKPELPVGKVIGKLPNRPRVIAGLAMVLLVVLGLATLRFLTTDPFEHNLNNLRSHNSEIAASSKWMSKFDKGFGSGISGGFAIAVSRVEDAKAVAEKLRMLDEGKPERERLLSHIATLDDLLPTDQPQKLKVLADIRALIDKLPEGERKKLQDLRPPDNLKVLGYDDIPEELAWPFTERDGTRGRLILANTGLGTNLWDTRDLERFASKVRSLGLGPEVLVGGSAFVFTDMLRAMERDGPRATLAAIVGSTLAVLLLVGRKRYAAVTLICGALGTLAMLACGWLVGLKVNFLDFVALPITIGIGIDYAVNIVARARQMEGPGMGRRSVTATGGAVLLCSYTTIVGYASLLFSQNRGIHTFGFSAMLGELTCISAALVVAPALLDVGSPHSSELPVQPVTEE